MQEDIITAMREKLNPIHGTGYLVLFKLLEPEIRNPKTNIYHDQNKLHRAVGLKPFTPSAAS